MTPFQRLQQAKERARRTHNLNGARRARIDTYDATDWARLMDLSLEAGYAATTMSGPAERALNRVSERAVDRLIRQLSFCSQADAESLRTHYELNQRNTP